MERPTATVERFTLLLAGVITAAVLYPVCALLFQCGCRWPWAGAATFCNVHDAVGPHCPWCQVGTLGFAAIAAVIVACEAGALALSRRLLGRRLGPSLLAVSLGFVAGALVAGLGAALLLGYPTLLGISLSPSR